MFVDSINPVIGSLGPFQIRYYGLVYSIGFLTLFFLLNWLARKKTINNFNQEKSDIFLIYLMSGTIIGARLFLFVFYEPLTLFKTPLEFFMIWHGGMSFHGGIIGGIIATLIFCRRHKVDFYKLADFVVMPAAFFLFIGRIANFINGELVGTKTNVPWCVIFPSYDNLPADQIIKDPSAFAQYCRHPSQLYEAGKNLVIFFATLAMYTKRKFKDGVIFWTFVLLYGILRFIENFWREDLRLFGLSEGQYLSLAMIPVAVYFLLKINGKFSKPKSNQKAKNTERKNQKT